ncbi:GyrI-like domain-containing protein [Oerskovia sp. Sa1BUA8]|uniref:GyrI-like domain-containing protein n=1 Tax=Oerskovia douganii TaxID=2762210 RepID=A0A9D5UFI6_9CELL|nr:GyrI-like domain-containing protein [Oerskovia douganii]MBE7699962.1 GyrI-like domain-containing protein [Oerskovia douganii]
MDKVDLRAVHRELYSPPREFVRVVVPPLRYLQIDGEGDPNTAPAHTEAVEALFPLAYAVKFASKKDLGRDYVVGPLEGLWTAEDPGTFVRREKDAWSWTLMILQPDWLTDAFVADVARATRRKKGLPALDRVRFVTYDEGDSVQVLHVGSYDDEAPTLARLHDEYLPAHGLTFNGPHHEIYLSDVRRTAPEKLRTVLRQPVRALDGA